MNLRKHALLASAIVAGSLVATPAALATLGGSSKVIITGREFSFTPNKWTIAADKEAVVALKNAGTVDHEWVVLKKAIKKESEYKKTNALVTLGPVKKGATGVAKVKLAKGTYMVICTVTGHLDGGMKGELTVK